TLQFDLVLDDANIAAGANLLVLGHDTFSTATTMRVDASAETDGTLTFTGNPGSDTFLGGAQGDTLDGAGSDDSLAGNGGADLLPGGGGNDPISGGTGADIFTQNLMGLDVITDFSHADGDRIDLRPAGIASFSDLTAHASQVNGDVVIQDGTNSLTVKN